MKRRIGSLRGKPIVEGDENLLTQNELHEDNLNSNSDSNSGGSSGSAGGGMRYFKLNTTSIEEYDKFQLMKYAAAVAGMQEQNYFQNSINPDKYLLEEPFELYAIATCDEYLRLVIYDHYSPDEYNNDVSACYELINKYCTECTVDEFKSLLVKHRPE